MYKLINNNLFQIDIKLEIGFKMGNQICFNKKENFISALDERELSEAIRLQKIIIYKKIKEINKISSSYHKEVLKMKKIILREVGD